MSENATVNIPKDVLEPIVRAQVAAGIVAALGDTDKLIERVVGLALNQKVDEEGKVSDRDYYNKYDLVELMAKKGIHQVVKQALAKWVEEQRPAIEAQVKKALSRKQGAFAKSLVDGVIGSAKQEWRFECKINLDKED